jgi:hypothetical protein
MVSIWLFFFALSIALIRLVTRMMMTRRRRRRNILTRPLLHALAIHIHALHTNYYSTRHNNTHAGNYRCSLAGADLNRKYQSNATNLYPTILAMRNLLKGMQLKRGIHLYLDLHGHSESLLLYLYNLSFSQLIDMTVLTSLCSHVIATVLIPLKVRRRTLSSMAVMS